ncbi:MAG: hypothetical protein IKP45_11800 [Bacteroidales bacterium]|nr:hypothetical protein [Bacteroidales bacterium]
MKNVFITLAFASLMIATFSCQPAKDDLEAREEKLSKEIDKINVQSTHRDIMMLYFDIIEDVYNQGKESGNYDLKRLEDFENGLIKDFNDKLDFGSKEFWDEDDDRYDESMYERMENLRPMMEEMLGDAYAGDEEYDEPVMLEDSSFVIGKDTIKELEDGRIIINRDTLTYEEFMQKLGVNE